MSATETAILRAFQQEMIAVARKIQEENYLGDEYYLQDLWQEWLDDGYTPEDAVREDMTYWD